MSMNYEALAVYLKDKKQTISANLKDKIEIPKESSRFEDAKGNLSFVMDICRDGVQEYLASEVLPADILKQAELSGNTILKVWRPPHVVFDSAKIKAHDGLSLTRNHPNGFVDSSNRAHLEKGLNRGSFFDPKKSVISGTGFVTDPMMVREIKSGEFNEISDGYDASLDFEPGVVPEEDQGFKCTDAGEEYDLVMNDYKPNHIAIVPEGRAGNARIHDKRGGRAVSGEAKVSFWDKLRGKNKISEARKMIDSIGAANVLRCLADEAEDEEQKATLEALAEDAEAAVEQTPVDTSNSENRVVEDAEPESEEEEEVEMTKKEMQDMFDEMVRSRFGDADPNRDIVVDEEMVDPEDPEVVSEIDMADEDVPVTVDALFKMAKESTDPAIKKMARALAEKLEGTADEEPAAPVTDAEEDPEVTEEEAEVVDGNTESTPAEKVNGYFIPNKISDAKGFPVLVGRVMDTVSVFGIDGIDIHKEVTDGTIYHHLIDAAGVGPISKPEDITVDRINMAINAILKNRVKVDGVSQLFDHKNEGSFNPSEL